MSRPIALAADLANRFSATAALVTQSPHDEDPIVAAEGLRHLTRLITAASQVSMEAADAEYPQFHRILSPYLQYGIPATDCAYLYAPVLASHTYRIFGRIGTSRLFHVEVSREIVPHLDRWTRFAGLEDFEVGPNGELEIILSREEHPGNWIPLPDGDNLGSVLVRQYFYDWENEEPAHINIERVGAIYPPPPYSMERAEAGLALIREFFEIVPPLCAQAVQPFYAANPTEITFAPLAFGWKDISYGRGTFRCEPDDAVIIEVVPPVSTYWSFQLMNHQWEALDWNLRQTSINGHQAVLDSDGVFRAVIAHTDPGVANWLDPAGHRVGLIAARYFRPESVSPARLKVVPLKALDEHLPADTARVTAEARQESLRRRMLSVRRRGCD